MGEVLAMVQRLGLVQIDSVNVLARAHYLPLFARLGLYDRRLLDDAAYRDRALFEQWGHAASLLPIEQYPMLAHRMAKGHRWHIERMAAEKMAYFERVLELVRERGPVTAGEVESASPAGWWNWSEGKQALEWHFAHGSLAVRERRNFARVYDLPERVFSSEVLNRPALPQEAAHRQMLTLGARALGLGTEADVADYYRLKLGEARPRLRELVDAGELELVEVEDWAEPAYLVPCPAVPGAEGTAALLGPFDSLVWNRARTERLFGFRYRIEIYTPAPRRTFGYYVMPFLKDGRLVGRADLKADRKAKALLLRGAFAEPGCDTAETAASLEGELHRVAEWLGLERIVVTPNGELAHRLAATPG
jgi:hypothetical protein